MFENKTEQQAKDEILKMVAEYCDTYHNKKEYHEGDRIPYASRVYDHEEMCNLVDSALEFWLTSGRYTCLLYTSPSPRDGLLSRMPSSA